MSRANRQLKIMEIISTYDVDTQEGLVEHLRNEGFKVTQATISRDIKDMGIIKTLAVDGRHYKYALQQAKENTTTDKFLNMFKNGLASIHSSGNLIVIKTEEACAGPVAQFLDTLNFPEVLGVVAGENTIFVAVDDATHADHVRDRLETLLGT